MKNIEPEIVRMMMTMFSVSVSMEFDLLRAITKLIEFRRGCFD